jgi:hypothetical protein
LSLLLFDRSCRPPPALSIKDRPLSFDAEVDDHDEDDWGLSTSIANVQESSGSDGASFSFDHTPTSIRNHVRSGVHKEGYLYKQGGTLKAWKSRLEGRSLYCLLLCTNKTVCELMRYRYFELKYGQMSYYKDETKAELLGTVELLDVDRITSDGTESE